MIITRARHFAFLDERTGPPFLLFAAGSTEKPAGRSSTFRGACSSVALERLVAPPAAAVLLAVVLLAVVLLGVGAVVDVAATLAATFVCAGELGSPVVHEASRRAAGTARRAPDRRRRRGMPRR